MMGVPEKRAVVVELVGPAGAGKTTLLRALRQSNPGITTGLQLPKTRQLFCLLDNTLRFAPTFLRQYRQSRWFSRGELRSMAYLKGWQQMIKRRAADSDAVIVFDHGPIFRLAFLQQFGPEMTKSGVFLKWWNDMLDQWAGALHLIIWLDAADAVLFDRINSRSVNHAFKGRPKYEVQRFLARYRNTYEQIIAKMAAGRGVQLLRVDTHGEPVDAIVSEVLHKLGLHPTLTQPSVRAPPQ